jgi:hypothetical protein
VHQRLRQPRLEPVCCKTWRTVSYDTDSTTCSATSRSDSSRNVQRWRPSGGAPHVSATRWASRSPSSRRREDCAGGLRSIAASSPAVTSRGPGRLDQLGAQVGVAGLGEVASGGPLAAGILAGHQAAEPHEPAGPGEPAPVADLGGQREGAQPGHAPVGGQAGHPLGGGRPVIPAGQVRLDRVQLGVAGLQHRLVVVVGGSQRGLVEPLGQQPALVRLGPGGGPTAPDAAVARQELAQPVPSAGAVSDHVGAGAAQVPHRFLGDGGDADSDQLAGAVQPSQPPAVTLVGLDLVTGRSGDQRRRDHLAADTQLFQQPGQLEPGPTRLVAGSQPTGVTQAANEPAHRRLIVGIRSTSGTCWSGVRIPTEIVSWWTSRPRWIGAGCETLATAGSFRMSAPPAQCG